MSVVEMKFFVYGAWERAVMNEAFTMIEKAREAQMEALKGNVPAGQLEQPTERPAHPDEAEPQPQVIAKITPDAVMVAKPEATEDRIKETEMAAVVQKALDTLGLAKTREIVNPLTGGKRWREADKATWPAIKSALEAAL